MQKETNTAMKMGKVGLGVTLSLIPLGIILGHYAKWVGDALYYLATQITAAQKDLWDRLPVHLDNLLGNHAFAFFTEGQEVSPLWVYCRHGARNLGIALLAVWLVKMAIQKPLAKRHHYGVIRLAATPVIAWLLALPIWIGGLAFFWTYSKNGFGWTYTGTNPWIDDLAQLIGKASIEYTIIGIISGLVITLFGVVKKPADEFQWLLAEQGWPSVIPGMGKRKKFLADPACPIVAGPKRPWVTRLVFWSMTASLGLAAFGAWLTLAGPAKGAA